MIDSLRYAIDNLFARGTKALLLVLSLAVALQIVLLTSALVALGSTPGPDATLLDKVWTVFMYTFDPSGVAYTDGDWTFRLVMLAASLGGIFVLSLLVGILANGFAEAVTTLRKGKSIVVEEGHTLILGWGEQIFSVIHQLQVANENQDSGCVVILAEQDKVFMEDAIRSRVQSIGRTRVVCRSGSPTNASDLEIVKPQHAKSIIILDRPTEPADQSDILTIKVLLALMRFRDGGTVGNLVATIRDEENLHVAELASEGTASIVPSDVIVSQIITQTARQPGLSLVYSELLAFEGNEFYIHREPAVVDQAFRDILFAYDTSTVVGVRRADGKVLVNPPMDLVVEEGDSLIVLADDDDTIKPRNSNVAEPPIQSEAITAVEASAPEPENILLLEWSERTRFILSELATYVAKGTRIVIVDREDVSSEINALRDRFPHLVLEFHCGSPASRRVLDQLSIRDFTSVIILADRSKDAQEADARTLMSLIHLRDIIGSAHTSVNIVTEMLDERNRSLASIDGVHDFIISNTLISLLLTQIAESKDLYAVFIELFNATGCEVYLKPIERYVAPDREVSFATLVRSAAMRNEIAIGVKRRKGAGWVVDLNVAKAAMLTFSADDRLVVISDD